jgi:ribosomal protein L23
MIAIDFNRLIQSVTYYLSYQDKIGRGFMVDESSLKYPVADYLTSLEMPLANIQLEFSHPDLWKRQIDLITTDQPDRKLKQKVESAYEFKISRQNTKYEPEQKRIFNDLMRLYFVGKSNGSSCYFIIAGTQKDYIQYFRSIATKRPAPNNKDLPIPEGFYTEWFNFKAGEVKTFDVKKTTVKIYEDIYTAFLNDYKPKIDTDTLELPDKLTTTCIAISALSREFPTPYVGGIWKIE